MNDVDKLFVQTQNYRFEESVTLFGQHVTKLVEAIKPTVETSVGNVPGLPVIDPVDFSAFQPTPYPNKSLTVTQIKLHDLKTLLRRALNTQDPHKIPEWAMELSDAVENYTATNSHLTITLVIDC